MTVLGITLVMRKLSNGSPYSTLHTYWRLLGREENKAFSNIEIKQLPHVMVARHVLAVNYVIGKQYPEKSINVYIMRNIIVSLSHYICKAWLKTKAKPNQNCVERTIKTPPHYTTDRRIWALHRTLNRCTDFF